MTFLEDHGAAILYYVSPSALGDADFSPTESAILARLNQKVAGAESLEALMNTLFNATHAIFPCDRIGLAFVEEDGRRVTSHWVRTLYEPVCLQKGYSEDLHASSLQRVLEGGQVRIIPDLPAYLRKYPRSVSTKLLVAEGVGSSMTCPLYVEKRVVALLFRSSRRPHDYSEHLVRLHLAVAERLSQAVEKAWRIEQLTAANRAYTEMLGFVSHELKSPLASLVMDGQLLTEGYLGQLEPRQHEKVRRMIDKGQFLLTLIRDYLDLAQIEGQELQLHPRDEVDLLAEIVSPALDIVRPQQEARHMMVILPAPGLRVQGDADLLKIVLINLLSNAVKYGHEGGQIKIATERTEGKFTVSVWNEGPGFPPGEKSRLFRRFSRLQTPELLRQKGTGVGLYTAKRIIQLHHGHISADSEPGHWACFTCEIPQPLPAARKMG